MSDPSDFETWLAQGWTAGYVGPPICATHDGVPTSEAEDEQVEDGDDPCVHVLRLYADPQEKRAVESSHSPSVWRASNRGLITPPQ